DDTKEISFDTLVPLSGANDVDGSVSAFVVKEVSNGSLKIGLDAASASAWATGTNDAIDATHKAFWTPPLDANGTLVGFTIAARDNEGASSSTVAAVSVEVAAVADRPVLTLDANLGPIQEDVASSYVEGVLGGPLANPGNALASLLR